jgi:hypothetical protein
MIDKLSFFYQSSVTLLISNNNAYRKFVRQCHRSNRIRGCKLSYLEHIGQPYGIFKNNEKFYIWFIIVYHYFNFIK